MKYYSSIVLIGILNLGCVKIEPMAQSPIHEATQFTSAYNSLFKKEVGYRCVLEDIDDKTESSIFITSKKSEDDEALIHNFFVARENSFEAFPQINLGNIELYEIKYSTYEDFIYEADLLMPAENKAHISFDEKLNEFSIVLTESNQQEEVTTNDTHYGISECVQEYRMIPNTFTEDIVREN